ncbi:hypothetical protein GWI33_001098, partial [Rhynchophorus ferrugineus]
MKLCRRKEINEDPNDMVLKSGRTGLASSNIIVE